MSAIDDLSRISEAVDKISKTGVPLDLNHGLDTTTITNMAIALCFVALVAVVLTGVKDVIVHRVNK